MSAPSLAREHEHEAVAAACERAPNETVPIQEVEGGERMPAISSHPPGRSNRSPDRCVALLLSLARDLVLPALAHPDRRPTAQSGGTKGHITAEGWPALTDRSFAAFYRALFSQLNALWPTLLAHVDPKRGKVLSDAPAAAVLIVVRKLVLLFVMLVAYTKHAVLASKPVQSCVLKEGRRFVEAFVRTMPLLEAQFGRHQRAVIETLKASRACLDAPNR